MIHHGDTGPQRKLLHEGLTEQIMGAAVEVHRTLGPGLLESAYLKLLNMRVGLILNFHVAALVRGGIVRKVL
jgi:hypothetical protein